MSDDAKRIKEELENGKLKILEERVQGSVQIVAFSGRLTQGEGARLFSERMHQLLTNSHGLSKLVLDVQDVQAFDSDGIGEMLSVFSYGRKLGVVVVLLTKPDSRLVGILDFTKLYNVFHVAYSLESALEI